MNEPKYKIGDRVTINGLPVEIVKVKPTLNIGTTYLIQFVATPAMKGVLTENEIDNNR